MTTFGSLFTPIFLIYIENNCAYNLMPFNTHNVLVNLYNNYNLLFRDLKTLAAGRKYPDRFLTAEVNYL